MAFWLETRKTQTGSAFKFYSKNEQIEVDLEYLIEQSILWDQMTSTAELLNELNPITSASLQTQVVSQQLTPTFTIAPTTPIPAIAPTSSTTATLANGTNTAANGGVGQPSGNSENLGSGISVRAAINTFNFLSNLNNSNQTRPSTAASRNDVQSSTDQLVQPFVDDRNQQNLFIPTMESDSLMDHQTSLSQLARTQQTDYDNFIFLHSWSECLGIFLSYDYVFTKCPQSRIEAWPFIHTRLIQLLPYVDPNDTSNEPSTRTSLFGGQPSLDKLRRQANERLNHLNIWKNYLICSFSLTPGSGWFRLSLWRPVFSSQIKCFLTSR